jgi:hypothetical protein
MTTQNVLFRSVFSGVACFLLFITLSPAALFPPSAVAGYSQARHTDANEEWAQPTFHGLVVGKSTAADVVREFGKPKWKGGVQDLVVPSDKQGEIQYQYSAVPDVNGDVYVVLGKRSGVVTAILFYPKKMTHDDVIAKFGSDYEESNVKLGPCPTSRERKIVAGYHQEYSTLLVYRKLGLAVDINQDGSAFLVEYLIRCR